MRRLGTQTKAGAPSPESNGRIPDPQRSVGLSVIVPRLSVGWVRPPKTATQTIWPLENVPQGPPAYCSRENKQPLYYPWHLLLGILCDLGDRARR